MIEIVIVQFSYNTQKKMGYQMEANLVFFYPVNNNTWKFETRIKMHQITLGRQ